MSSLRELIKRHAESDSRQEVSEIESQIEDLCANHAKAEYKLHAKYGLTRLLNSYDYLPDKGGWTFDYVNDWEHQVHLYYEDSWGYGGHCKFGRTFKADEVDKFDPVALEKQLLTTKRNNVSWEIQNLKDQLTKKEKELEDLNYASGSISSNQ